MSSLMPSAGKPDLDRRAFLAGLAGVTMLTAGCGADTYQQRLLETKRYFEYLDQVNVMLNRAVKFEGFEIRVPKLLDQLVSPPTPAEGEPPAQPLPPSEDPTRMGYFPNVVLEGVMASWKGTARTEGPGQSEGEAPVYLHLLSNWQRWIDKQTNNDIEPTRYLLELTNQVATALNLQADTSDTPWDWDMMRGLSPYVPKKKIETITIDLGDHNPPLEVHFFKTEAKDVHCALLLIVPKNIDAREKMEPRIKLTLETLKVPSTPPQLPAAKGAPASGF